MAQDGRNFIVIAKQQSRIHLDNLCKPARVDIILNLHPFFARVLPLEYGVNV